MERDKNYFEKKGKTAENILHNLKIQRTVFWFDQA